MKDRIKEVLEDHRGWDDLDYLAGLIEYRIRERQREENLGIERIGEQSTAEKISQHKTDGIEYKERRVKSYGFFKNEYYDD